MKAPKKPKKVDTPKHNTKLAVKKLIKRTTAEPPRETNAFCKIFFKFYIASFLS